MEVSLDYSGGPNVRTRVFKSGRGRQKSQRKKCKWQKQGQREATLLALKMKKVVNEPRSAAALRSWKERENQFLDFPEGKAARLDF